MAFFPVWIEEDPETQRNHSHIMEAVKSAESFVFPPKVTSTYSKAKMFKKANPEYHRVPNSLLRGLYEFGRPMTDGTVGFRLKHGSVLSVWGLGDIRLKRDMYHIKKIQRIFFGGEEVVFYGMGKIFPNRRLVLKDYSQEDFHHLVQDDPIFRYLKVNLIFTEYGFKKACAIRDVIAYFDENPNLTRKELERMGIRGNKLWDLVVNYQKSLDVWLRAGSKPKEGEYKTGHYILSKGQHDKRIKREWSLSEHIQNSDIDAGKLKNQSFDSQIFELMRSNRESFFG